MKISELPTAIKNRALKYQRELGNENQKTDNLIDAFVWDKTREGIKYWEELHNAKEFFTLERSEQL